MHYVWDRGNSADIETVSDYVTPAKIDSWEPGDNVLIVAPTGAGKSYYVQHTLHDYLAKNGLRCLYLVSRTRNKEQFQQYLSGSNVIQFMTYQAVQKIMSKPNASMGKWDVLILDEAHYFFNDSSFNNGTDIAFDWIMEQRDAIRVFMSATGDILIESFDDWGIPYVGYVLEAEHAPINSLSFFRSDTQLERLAAQIIAGGGKGVFFIQSAEKAYALYRKFKDNGLFLCSSYNKEFSKYIDKIAIDNMLENEQFNCTLLITTTALDVGVTLKDRRLTTVVIDVTEPATILQCVGRKRLLDDSDELNVYISIRDNRQISGLLVKQRKRLKTVQDVISNGPTSYTAEHERGNDSERLVFDSPETDGEKTTFSKFVNKMKYTKIQRDIKMYEEMLQLDGDGFVTYVARLLGVEKYTVMEEEADKVILANYLDSIVGVQMLTKADREPLIERLNIQRNGRLCRTYRTLAGWLEDHGLPYRLHEYRTNRTVDGERKSYRAWEVIRLAK